MGSTCRVKSLAVCEEGIPPAGEVGQMPGNGVMLEITSKAETCGKVARDYRSRHESQVWKRARVEGCGIADKGGLVKVRDNDER